MGTNFYMHTKDKKLAEEIGNYTLTDEPEFGYEIHIGKRSCGWLPLFQETAGIKSVKDIEKYCKMPGVRIFDEYNTEFTWKQLKEELINWNGGINGAIPKEFVDKGKPGDPFYDPDMPCHVPVSHFEYGNGKYASRHFKDPEGYEFARDDFC